MDNLTAPIPSTPTQSAFSSPVGSLNHRWLLWLSCGLAVLALGIVVGIFSAKFFSQYQNEPQVSLVPLVTPTTALSTQSSLTPGWSPEPIYVPVATTLPSSREGWLVYTDKTLGFSLEFPSDWFLDDSLKRPSSFRGRCFGKQKVEDNWGDGLLNPRFCVDSKPWISFEADGRSSNIDGAQKNFFEYLKSKKTGESWIIRSSQYIVTKIFQFLGFPAVERTGSLAPGVEGTEIFYFDEIFIQSDRGLFRLSMHESDISQFKKHESVLRQILSTFKFLD